MKKLIILIALTGILQAGVCDHARYVDDKKICFMREQNKLQVKQIQVLKDQNKLLKQIVDAIRKGR